MTETSGTNRRRQRRQQWSTSKRVQLWIQKEEDAWQRIPGELENASDFGIGVVVARAVPAGTVILIDGAPAAPTAAGRAKALVIWCQPLEDARFRLGLALEQRPASPTGSQEFVDLYAVLEVHPGASLDTIHRVYRIVAQRVHPDNPETGSEDRFKEVSAAYRVLGNPELRAQYDVHHAEHTARQWKVFDPKSATVGVEAEKRKRRAVLAALYIKRVQSPHSPGIGIPELEQLLGIPREHLEFTIWFLREQNWLQRADNGRLTITAPGVVEAEASGAWQAPGIAEDHLLQAAVSKP